MVRGLLAGLALLVCLPLLVVVVLASPPPAPAAAAPLAGTGGGLRPGSVPEKYWASVLSAGALCAAAPSAVIAAQIEQESGWNPTAVSPAGAQGISQFMPGTWPHWSLPGQSPLDPAAAIAAQGRYDCGLAAQLAPLQAAGKLGKADLTSLMLAGYNAGPAAVIGHGGIPPFAETQHYVSTIIAAAAKFAGATGGVVAGGPAIAAPPGSFAAREIAAAQRWLGTPYSWAAGGNVGPTSGVCGDGSAWNDCHITGFDCSGLVMFAVYQASGGKISLAHFADTQTRGGTPVALNALLPGDLISFADHGNPVAHHVGIYLGGGKMINAPESGALVRIDSLTTSYYRSQDWRAVRYG